uniref:Small ribosomal subunit protein bS18c n=1 Tax=Pseudochlorodesmis sp. HV01306a TaxID=2358488 RepID=A0A386AY36_9CHLO|nr:ribosomal protein S18 [Pseudochlorodesmis sp. HV01306a]
MKKFQNKFNLKKKKNLNQLNYKNILLLRNYITVSGKIIPKRLNNLTATQQRQLTRAIKNARLLSFLPFVRLIEL